MLAQLTAPLYRRLLKVAVMVGIVGALSLSLVVTTPSNAYAFSNGDTLFKEAPRIMGAVKTISPAVTTVAAVATSVTPAGWLLKGGVSLIMLGLSTQDVWMPYVTGLFGAGGNAGGGTNEPVSPTNVQPVSQDLELSTPIFNGEYASARLTRLNQPQAGGTFSYTVAVRVECKFSAGANIFINTSATANNVTMPAQDQTVQVRCQFHNGSFMVYGTPVGAEWGLTGTRQFVAYNPGVHRNGPKNYLTIGTFGGAPGFDPRGANVGYQGQSECIDAAGNLSWITGETIGGNAGGVVMPSCAAAGKGHGTGRTKVIAFKPDGTQETVWDVPVAPSDPATPLCNPGMPSSGCTLEVLKDEQPCTTGDVECENWASEQSKDPTRWKCKFGPYTLPMASCRMLEQAYRPGGALATDANTDGDPATKDDTNYAGQPVPQPAGSSVTTGTGTGGQPVPGGSGQTTPSADAESKQCFPQGWAALNPVEWVVKPVGCALRSAFVPSEPVVQAQATRIKTKLGTAGFQQVTAAWTGTFQQVGGGSGCTGPTINFSMMGVNQVLQPFNACTAPMSTVAGVSYAVSSIFIVVLGGLGVARAIATGFGFNFTLGKGASDS